MRLLDQLLGRTSGAPRRRKASRVRQARPTLELLEERRLLDATGVLAAGTLFITGDPSFNNIHVVLDPNANQIVVTNFNATVGRFDATAVTALNINVPGTLNAVQVDQAITVPEFIAGSSAQRNANFLQAGGGDSIVSGGTGINRLSGGVGTNTLDGSNGFVNVFGDQSRGGTNTYVGNPGGAAVERFFGHADKDTIVTPLTPLVDQDLRDNVSPPNLTQFDGLTPSPQVTINASEVDTLLQRASAATATSNQAIVAIVDRSGRILGVRIGSGVSTAITGDPEKLVFAIDGAIAEARTGAFFGNNQAPLTSRTIQDISQTTVSQREVESDPNVTDPNSTVRGPGTVSPIGIKSHFPPGIANTPQVDLFGIEYTNRDSIFAVGPDNIRGTADDVQLQQRFNINPAFYSPNIPVSQYLSPPDSYGVESGLLPTAQARGIGTLPGGIPIYKTDPVSGQTAEVGGIGVFFPGTTGYSDEENSVLSSNFDPTKRDLSFEAEYIAFAALGGSSSANARIGTLGGVAPLANFDLPSGRIDLVGITLDIFGPTGNQGVPNLLQLGAELGTGQVNGALQPLLNFGPTNLQHFVGPAGAPVVAPDETPTFLKDGTLVPEGYIVTPHDAADGSIKAADVQTIINDGIQQAVQTRAAIRLPLSSPTAMVFAVTSKSGEIVGLFRMPDATIFSIDVAVAKARNAAYYDNASLLQPADQLPGVPAGTAFTARTFRYISLPFFPEGIDSAPPGPFSQLNNDPNTNRVTGLENGPRQPASAYQADFGFSNFNPGTNFHDFRNTGVFTGPGAFQNPLLNRDGVVFFPGSAPLYASDALIGAVGVSGDGVDQDDVVTAAARSVFDVPSNVLRADQTFFSGIRLPFQKFNRQPINDKVVQSTDPINAQ